jgi:hypothetical protein
MNKQFLQSLLQMLGLEKNYNWGKYKIEISGQHFDSVSAIPLEIVRNHSDINDYRIKIAHTKKELEAFIVFRLVDKLNYPYEKQQLKLTQQKIPSMVLDEEFMNSFVSFLRAQIFASVYNDLENLILKSKRNQSGQIQDSYKAKTPLRQHNVSIRKMKSQEADAKWEKVVNIASRIP